VNSKEAFVFVNLGTPDAPKVSAVRRYLREFLSDPFVIDIPAVLRWILVYLIIVPFRAKKSTHAYSQIWSERGSPLRFHSEDFVSQLQAQRKETTILAMRYGKPQLFQQLKNLKQQGVKKIFLLPLYPQYALSTTETTLDVARKWQRSYGEGQVDVFYLREFYRHPAFLKSWVINIKEHISSKPVDRVLFSFHGLPVRHIKKVAKGCLENPGCCEVIRPANQLCYRMQCVQTAEALAKELGLATDQWQVSFQSRLGKDAWLEPYTDQVLPHWAKTGVKTVAVVAPSFVADCLETLEEIAIRAREDFKAAGGEELFLVPSLNSNPQWVSAVSEILDEKSLWHPL